MRAVLRFLPVACLALAACASPTFPESGAPTPYDGQWSGTLPSDKTGCDGITFTAEVRYGYLIGVARQKNAKVADIWGQISSDGSWNGALGKAGISGGASSARFTEESASGTWSSASCDGTLELRKSN